MPFSTTQANEILNWVMGKTGALAARNQVWLGLCSNDPEADGGIFTELSGNGYGRVLINQYNETYPGLISSATERTIKNVRQIGFTKATGGAWVAAKGYGLFTQETGGTPFYYTSLKTAVSTPEGAVFLLDPEALKIDFRTADVDIT